MLSVRLFRAAQSLMFSISAERVATPEAAGNARYYEISVICKFNNSVAMTESFQIG